MMQCYHADMNSHEQSSINLALGHVPRGHASGGQGLSHTFGLRITTCLVLTLSFVLPPMSLAEEAKAEALDVTSGNTQIFIRAEKAWEDEDEDVLYLEGEFHMRTEDWEVRAERAEVHGPVEDPDKIIGYGKPASIRVTLGDNEGQGTGYSNRIVYMYQTKMLELHDDARMEMKKVTVRSAAIIYDVGNKKLISGGKQGVEFVLQKDSPPAQ